MLYLIKIRIENKQEKYCCIEATNTVEAKNILQDIDRNLDNQNDYHIQEIIDYTQIEFDNQKLKELKLENKIIRNFSDWERNKKKLNLSKFPLTYKISKLIIYVGIGCLTSLIYIKAILELKNKSLLNLNETQLKNSYFVTHYNNLHELLILVCFIGFMLILLGVQIRYFYYVNRKSRNTLYKILNLITGIFLAIISTLFVLLPNSLENGTAEFFGISVTIWIILICLNLDNIIKAIMRVFNGYINLENKEQYTLGIAIVTFVLGLLFAK